MENTTSTMTSVPSATVSHRRTVAVEMASQPATDHRTHHEAGERDDRRGQVDPGMRSEPEAEKYDVARHIGDEHMAEHQHTDGIDDAGGECQQQQAGNGQPL